MLLFSIALRLRLLRDRREAFAGSSLPDDCTERNRPAGPLPLQRSPQNRFGRRSTQTPPASVPRQLLYVPVQGGEWDNQKPFLQWLQSSKHFPENFHIREDNTRADDSPRINGVLELRETLKPLDRFRIDGVEDSPSDACLVVNHVAVERLTAFCVELRHVFLGG
jgi:hypothetical protein